MKKMCKVETTAEFVYGANDLALVTTPVDKSNPDGAVYTIINDNLPSNR